MTTMHVRRARGDDRARMFALWDRSVRATHHFLSPEDVAALAPFVVEELASDAIGWWVLVDGGLVTGFLGVVNDRIEGLFVDPDQQGRGSGRFLVAHAQQLCGCALAVDVNEQNEAALRFYQALGFSVVDRSPTDAGGRPYPILHMRRAAPDDPRTVAAPAVASWNSNRAPG